MKMSKIDWGKQITPEDKATDAAVTRAKSIKMDCQQRIYAIIPETAQTNAGNATTAFATKIARGTPLEDTLREIGLSEEDLDTIELGRVWIEAMQAECRRAIAQGDDPAWPDVPTGVSDLAKRF